jgi:hypothetical protein
MNDYTTLNNPRFMFRAEMHRPFPDWVVSEAMPEAADFLSKSAAAFADPQRRLLPICSKSAAFHSAINIFAQPDDFDEATLERVKEACAHYDIESDILPYAELFSDEFTKSASLDELAEGRYAISDEIDGEAFRLLPLNDADDVLGSSFELAKMASDNRIPLLMFVLASRAVVKAASDYNLTARLPALITRHGIERFADAETAAAKISGREQFCKDASVREVVAADYLDAIKDMEADPDGAMLKIAAIDDFAGVSNNYRQSSLVPTAFDIVFGGALVEDAEKAARENVLVHDVLLPLEEVRAIAPMNAQYRLSKSAAETFARLRDTGDARDLSLAVENWDERDQRTLLRMTVEAAA